MLSEPSISFAEQDVACFSNASGDRNPLHLSHEYARRTPYGQQVVFGCLGAVACLGHVRLPAGWSATSLEAEFARPMFLGVPYRVEVSEKEGKWRARLFDGSALVVSVAVTAELSHRNEAREEVAVGSVFERCDAAVRREQDIVPGLEISGAYACNPVALANVSGAMGGRGSAPGHAALLEQLFGWDGAAWRIRSFLQARLALPRNGSAPR